METTKLSSKGQIIIPKPIRNKYRWETGQEFIVVNTDDGVLLKPKKPFPATMLDKVAGCLKYEGPAKTLAEMEEAVRQGVQELYHGDA